MSLLTRLTIDAVLVLATILLPGGAAVLMNELWANPEATQKSKSADPKEVPLPQVQDQPGRVDVYGDPLPQGALARMGTARLRGEVLTFSADGKTLITVGADRAFHYWD